MNGKGIANTLVNLRDLPPEEAVELLCEALDWCWAYLPADAERDRHEEEYRSVIGRRFPQLSASPIMSREDSVAITSAARRRFGGQTVAT